MKLNKLFSALCAVALVVGFTACSDKEDIVEELLNSQQVYFPNTLATTFEITADAASVEVPVMRMGDDAASVPVVATVGEENVVELSVPAEVAFAAGQKKSSIVINYNPEKVEPGHYDEVTLSFGDDYNTPYGDSKVTLKIGQAEPWVSLGNGTFNEDFYFGTGNLKCEIFQNALRPNLYRVRNLVIDFLKSEEIEVNAGASEWIYFQLLHPGDECLGQTIPEGLEDLVYFYSDGPHSSVSWGYTHPTYNDDLCFVFPGIFTSLSDPENWIHNRVLGYKEDGTPGAVQLAGNYYMFNTGGFGGQDDDGDLIITFPDYVIADYSCEVATVGRLIDKKENGQAVFDVALGEDVASAKVAFAAGKKPEAAYELIANGDESVVTLTASGEVRFAYDESGDYVCVAAVYDADGKEQGVSYSLINIPAGGGAEVFEAIFNGEYTHGVATFAADGSLPFGESFTDPATLYVSTADESRYLISPWINKGYEETESLGEGMLFIWDEEGNITVPQSFTGVPTNYGEMWAWDFVTAEVADMPCEYDPQNGVFTFYLAWSVEAGDFGYTADTFVLTEACEAKARAPKRFNMRKTLDRKLPAAKKAAAKKHFKLTSSRKPSARFKK